MLLDEILGDFDKRYFGAGHKHTNYYLDKVFTTQEDGFVGQASIKHNQVWSEKNGQPVRPHVSTIDGLIFVALLIEAYMAKNKPDVKLADFYLCAFEIKAGSKPIEDLQAIPLVMEGVEMKADLLYFKVNILGMRVEVWFKQKINKNLPCYDSDEKLDYISEHLKHLRHDFTDFNFIDTKTVLCKFVREEIDFPSYKGLSSHWSNSVSILEWLIAFSQLAQVMAYQFDKIERQESETLWMRWIKGTMKEPVFYEERIPVSGEIMQSSLLNIGTDHWRTLDVQITTIDQNIQMVSKLAHRLPQESGDKHVV